MNPDIRPEDLTFYKKISPVFNGREYSIPPPALSPKEREQRRLAYRNERVLYKRKSDLSGKDLISVFPPDSPFTIYSQEEWWSDGWDPMEFGRDFDFNRPFFDQFHELELAVPRPPAVNNKSFNSDYCNFSDGNKNCYLISSANLNEDCYYGFCMVSNRNAVDCLWCMNSELLYECVDCTKSYNLRFAQNCDNCSDSAFLLNCKSVRHSLFCVNLNNKEYHLLNRPVTKEEYEQVLTAMEGSAQKYKEFIRKFEELKRQFPIRQASNIVSCEASTGNNIFNSNNIHLGFDVHESNDCAYLHDGYDSKDCYDVCFFGESELCYESTSLMGYGLRFTNFCRDSSNLLYCDNCHACKNCFGCVGLRNKEYCIFNRQYSQTEYEEQASKIAEHMMRTKEWGEFFPVSHSIYAYNETLAQDYFPMKKEEVVAKGWLWRDEKETSADTSKMDCLDPGQLPDHIREIPDNIVNRAIRCESSGKLYKIQAAELAFYRKMNLPVPRLHPDVRLMNRMKLRNGHQLWKRVCQKCGAEVLAVYAPDRTEKIYCKECYLREVY